MDNKIESFFDKIRNLKKYNQGKKKYYYLDNKVAISIASLVLLFFSYFLIPVFYKEDKIKASLINLISDRYDINIEFNEKVKYGLFPKPFFYTKNLDIKHNEKAIGNSGYVKFYISFSNFFLAENILPKDLVFQDTEFNINSNNIDFFLNGLKSSDRENKFIFKRSKFFYKDQNDDLLFLSKIKNFSFFYDDINNFQKVKSNFEIFNTPIIYFGEAEKQIFRKMKQSSKNKQIHKHINIILKTPMESIVSICDHYKAAFKNDKNIWPIWNTLSQVIVKGAHNCQIIF